MTLYIENAVYIDYENMTFTRTDIRVEEGINGKIEFVDTRTLDPDDPSKRIDAGGKWVTRSFGCGHHHIYSTLARGMPAPAAAPKNFTQILEYVWWHLDKHLDLDMIKASALASALFCAKNGITFVIDHHASPFAVEGSLSVIREAFDMVGISSLLCYEISDRDGEHIRNQGLAETENYLKAGHQGHVGLHASFTVGDDLLRQAVALAEKYRTGIHIHVAEDMADQDHCLAHYGRRVVRRLADAGVLDLKGSILAHCVHLSDEEKTLIENSPAWVVQNVESNLNNNVGVTGYDHHGPNIMLGTDGMHSDMLRSAKAAFFSGQGTEHLSYPAAYARFRNIHRFIREHQYAGDGDNNLVILDYPSPTDLTPENFLGHFIFGIESCHVDSVIASGQLIVEQKKSTRVSETDILLFARQMGNQLWKKLA